MCMNLTDGFKIPFQCPRQSILPDVYLIRKLGRGDYKRFWSNVNTLDALGVREERQGDGQIVDEQR